MSEFLKVLGPARSLLRVREQDARLRRVEAGMDATVWITLEWCETGRRLKIALDQATWAELRERVDRAFVFEG